MAQFGAQEHSFVLQHQRYGQVDLECASPDQRQQSSARATLGAKASNKHIRVEDHLRRSHSVSYAIPQRWMQEGTR